jgi:Ca2+-binding EF-hand superfamily protein
MPTFDKLLKDSDKNGDGVLSKEEAQNTDLKDSFDDSDPNKDGKLARDEWDAIIKFMLDGKNCAAVSGGRR